MKPGRFTTFWNLAIPSVNMRQRILHDLDIYSACHTHGGWLDHFVTPVTTTSASRDGFQWPKKIVRVSASLHILETAVSRYLEPVDPGTDFSPAPPFWPDCIAIFLVKLYRHWPLVQTQPTLSYSIGKCLNCKSDNCVTRQHLQHWCCFHYIAFSLIEGEPQSEVVDKTGCYLKSIYYVGSNMTK